MLVLTAFMIGMSNIIMEEDRMLHDTQFKTEQEKKEEVSD